MGTWVGAIVATNGRSDFWTIAEQHGIRRAGDAVPAYALINCDVGFDFRASVRLAETLSRELSTMAIGFVVQTTSDVHEMHTFVQGSCVRRLGYSRDDGGWLIVEGEPRDWERAYFFDEGTTSDEGVWPDLVFDDLSDGDAARYEEAKRMGDASAILPLLHPSSTEPMLRVCGFFGIKADEPSAHWKKPSFWSRCFGRR
jgi:hypothetical protein